MRLGDVDAGFDGVAEGHERRGTAEISALGTQTRALGLGRMGDSDARAGLVQLAQGH